MKNSIEIIENKVAQFEKFVKTQVQKERGMIAGCKNLKDAARVMHSEVYLSLVRENIRIDRDIRELKQAIAILQRVFLCEAAADSKNGNAKG